MNQAQPARWLLLSLTLPGRPASTTRVRLWRALRDLGAGSLRDGVSVLPASEAARAAFEALAREVNYGEGIFVGYRYFDKVELDPLFPFGHGLSYTKFKYGNVTAPARGKRGENISLTVDVTNVGDRPGAEVVQLYVSDKVSSLPRPRKELKGFEKVVLKPGETKSVEFRLDERSFAFYDPHAKKWTAESGDYEFLLGSSSRDIRSQKKFELL